MTYPCKTETKSAQPVLSIRTKTPMSEISEVLGRCFDKLSAYLEEQRMTPAGPPFTAYFNMDMDDMDIEVGIPVEKLAPGEGEIMSSEIPEGPRISCLHTGPYEDMTPAYEALSHFAQEEGLLPAGPAYEFYLNSPEDTAPEELQTVVMYPIKKPN